MLGVRMTFTRLACAAEWLWPAAEFYGADTLKGARPAAGVARLACGPLS
jgi:hypothetical protein